MKIAFVARNDGTDVRQTKICNSLVALGYSVAYIGWDRQPEKPKQLNLDPRIHRFIFARSAGFGEYRLDGWPQFFAFVARTLGLFQPAVVHARDEQIAALLLPLKGLAYQHLVLDIFDSLAARSFSNQLLAASAYSLRAVAHYGADRIIETSEELRAMLGPAAHKAVVVMNTPVDLGEELAYEYPNTSAVQICTGGSLSRQRDGLEVLLNAVDSLPAHTVEIQASGWLHDDYAREVFITHPAVHYRWLDSAEDFRRMAAHCDAITYLRTDATNSEYRSWVLPNRVFDAMSVGRPVIIPDTMKIAPWVEREGIGYVYTANDPDSLAALLHRLAGARAQLPEFARRVRDTFTRQYTWAIMEQRLAELYAGLGC